MQLAIDVLGIHYSKFEGKIVSSLLAYFWTKLSLLLGIIVAYKGGAACRLFSSGKNCPFLWAIPAFFLRA